MAAYKAEFQYQYMKANGASLRTRSFAYNTRMNHLGSLMPSVTNFFFTNKITSGILKKSLGVASERNLPKLSSQTLANYYKKNRRELQAPKKKVYLFNDEFTNYLESETGVAALKLL